LQTADAVSLFLASREARGLSPRTISWYRQILTKFEASWPTLPTRPENVELFLSKCPGKDECRHGYYRALKVFYRFLAKRYQVADPLTLIDAPKRSKKDPKTLTALQLYTLLNYPHCPRIAAALLFLADTGCRLGELYNLTPDDFIPTPQGYLATVNGKTGARLVPVSRGAVENLLPHLPFPYSKYRLCRHVSKAFSEAGIKGTAHSLRHTFATLWEGSEFALQRIMGHSDMKTLRIYRNLRTEMLSTQHNQFSPVARLPSSAMQLSLV
jgi:integrase/recombinase XerD